MIVLFFLIFCSSSWALDCVSMSVDPWANPAAAEMAAGQFPIQQYSAGQYLSTRYVYGSSDYSTIRTYRIDSVASTGTYSGCQTFTAIYPPSGANPIINSAGRLATTYGLDATGCGAGSIKYAQRQYNVTLVIPTASCTDGVLNGDETSIDCGGGCGPCGVGGAIIPQDQLIEFGKMASALVGSFSVLAFALAMGKSS